MLYNNLTPQLAKVFQLASNLPQVEQNWLAEALTDWFDQDSVTTDDDLEWETLLASSDSTHWAGENMKGSENRGALGEPDS